MHSSLSVLCILLGISFADLVDENVAMPSARWNPDDGTLIWTQVGDDSSPVGSGRGGNTQDVYDANSGYIKFHDLDNGPSKRQKTGNYYDPNSGYVRFGEQDRDRSHNSQKQEHRERGHREDNREPGKRERGERGIASPAKEDDLSQWGIDYHGADRPDIDHNTYQHRDAYMSHKESSVASEENHEEIVRASTPSFSNYRYAGFAGLTIVAVSGIAYFLLCPKPDSQYSLLGADEL